MYIPNPNISQQFSKPITKKVKKISGPRKINTPISRVDALKKRYPGKPITPSPIRPRPITPGPITRQPINDFNTATTMKRPSGLRKMVSTSDGSMLR